MAKTTDEKMKAPPPPPPDAMPLSKRAPETVQKPAIPARGRKKTAAIEEPELAGHFVFKQPHSQRIIPGIGIWSNKGSFYVGLPNTRDGQIIANVLRIETKTPSSAHLVAELPHRPRQENIDSAQTRENGAIAPLRYKIAFENEQARLKN